MHTKKKIFFPDLNSPKSKNTLKDLFDLKNLLSGYRSLVKPRDNNVRLYLILMVAVFQMEEFINIGEWGSAYLYLRRVLNFGLEDFARLFFCVCLLILKIFGRLIKYLCLYLLLYLHVQVYLCCWRGGDGSTIHSCAFCYREAEN